MRGASTPAARAALHRYQVAQARLAQPTGGKHKARLQAQAKDARRALRRLSK